MGEHPADNYQGDLIVGHTYRAKRPAPASNGCVNDRTIIWMGGHDRLQYDGPTVGLGAKFPACTVEQFRKWAARDVTDELPEERYMEWTAYQERRSHG